MTVSLQWTNDRPDGVDMNVIDDIQNTLGDRSPETIYYHTVFLGDDMEGAPGVIVEGEDGNTNFICTYYERIGDAFETLKPNEL